VDRATRRLFAVVLAALVLVAGGAAIFLSGTTMPEDEPPAGATAVVGVIVGVDAASLGDVRSFDLRLDDGTVRTFGLDELENADQFPPGHLGEHQVTAEPVRVWFRSTSAGDQAVRLEDAPR
jgi:hypothetical protein